MRFDLGSDLRGDLARLRSGIGYDDDVHPRRGRDAKDKHATASVAIRCFHEPRIVLANRSIRSAALSLNILDAL
jgi:hypothetical protein